LSALTRLQKYINVRELTPRSQREVFVAEQDDHHDPAQPLPEAVLQHVAKVDSAYVATAYLPADQPEESHLGMNHRGGRPGFLRVDPNSKCAIYLPDYSGNRLLQTLGNMLSTPLAGLALVDWSSGDVLYATGRTTVYLGQAAKEIMRSVHGIAKVEVTGYRLIRQALPLIQQGDTVWSEYNPPLRYLNSEPDSGFNPSLSNLAKAQIQAFRPLTDDLSVVSFKVTGAVDYKPGQYAILDCSSFLRPAARMYRHMAARGEEQTLNE
jgi:hypothetical protein